MPNAYLLQLVVPKQQKVYEQLAGKEKTLVLASQEEKGRIKQQIRDLKEEISGDEAERGQLQPGVDETRSLSRVQQLKHDRPWSVLVLT